APALPVSPRRPAIDLGIERGELLAIVGGRTGLEVQALPPPSEVPHALLGLATPQLLVDDRRAVGGHALDRVHLAPQIGQRGLVALRRHDVVRAPRIWRDTGAATTSRPADDVVELEHEAVADAAPAQLPRGCKPGDTTADDHDALVAPLRDRGQAPIA